MDDFNNDEVSYIFEYEYMWYFRTLQYFKEHVGSILTGFVSMRLIGGHSSPYFLSFSRKRLKDIPISTKWRAMHLYFRLRIFLCWEGGKTSRILCQVSLTRPHGLHGSEKKRWKSDVYGGFYHSFMFRWGVG